MAHYAILDENNVVVEVITGVDESQLIEGLTPEQWYANFKQKKCVRTSYNKKIRKNYAGIGFFYDENLDAFIPPKPFNSWILDEETCLWKSPEPKPEGQSWYWNEELGNWINAETV